MKHLLLSLFLLTFSVTAFAQFPLGSNKGEIKSFFAENIQYASVQEFNTDNGTPALCFTKSWALGDYTFYFDSFGVCTSYVVTYDKKELAETIQRFDTEFCRLQATKWADEDNTFEMTLQAPLGSQNYFSIVYKPQLPGIAANNTFASN